MLLWGICSKIKFQNLAIYVTLFLVDIRAKKMHRIWKLAMKATNIFVFFFFFYLHEPIRATSFHSFKKQWFLITKSNILGWDVITGKYSSKKKNNINTTHCHKRSIVILVLFDVSTHISTWISYVHFMLF